MHYFHFFFELFPLFKGPGRAHMGPYGPIWAQKIKNICKKFAFIGALHPALSYSLEIMSISSANSYSVSYTHLTLPTKRIV